jgi:hypothetical protein
MRPDPTPSPEAPSHPGAARRSIAAATLSGLAVLLGVGAYRRRRQSRKKKHAGKSVRCRGGRW